MRLNKYIALLLVCLFVCSTLITAHREKGKTFSYAGIAFASPDITGHLMKAIDDDSFSVDFFIPPAAYLMSRLDVSSTGYVTTESYLYSFDIIKTIFHPPKQSI